MRTGILKKACSAALLIAGAASYPAPASVLGYPIDCAIIICMSGGFPASAECLAAKAEVIRRITPIPVEPPLQIWKCPMSIDPLLAAKIGMPVLAGAVPPEVKAIQDGIELYDITYTGQRSHGEETISEVVKQGHYLNDGYSWGRSSYINGPEWLAAATGGYRKDIYKYFGNNGQYKRKVGTVNAHLGSFRAIVMRFKDYQGNYQTQEVPY